MENELADYTVTYIFTEAPENWFWFECKAEDGEHAREQCLNAEPTALIIQVEWNP